MLLLARERIIRHIFDFHYFVSLFLDRSTRRWIPSLDHERKITKASLIHFVQSFCNRGRNIPRFVRRYKRDISRRDTVRETQRTKNIPRRNLIRATCVRHKYYATQRRPPRTKCIERLNVVYRNNVRLSFVINKLAYDAIRFRTNVIATNNTII